MSEAVFIIAEAGVNHNGDTDLAKQLIDVAANAGADAVKFQTFQADQVVSRQAPKASYQIYSTGAGETQLEMLRKLALSDEAHEALIKHARKRGIRFLSTPFDGPSLRLLTERLGLDVIKIASGEITNAPFLVEVARSGRAVLLSTGMSTIGEVELALGALAYGYTTASASRPGPGSFRDAYASEEGQRRLRSRVSLLHCTSEYPAPFAEVNLRALDALAAAFGLPTGLSDHTVGVHIPVAAVARGATIIEKHFTLDRRLSGPDHVASLEPGELKGMVRAIREVEAALGDGIKRPSATEIKNREAARRSLVAVRPIQVGEEFTEHNMTCKRPGTGVTPFAYWQTLGQTAARNYDADEALDV